jgi:hypothetical protein
MKITYSWPSGQRIKKGRGYVRGGVLHPIGGIWHCNYCHRAFEFPECPCGRSREFGFSSTFTIHSVKALRRYIRKNAEVYRKHGTHVEFLLGYEGDLRVTIKLPKR